MGIYLDNAATSWPKPETVYEAVNQFMRAVGATPGRGGHRKEEEAARIADQTRKAIAELFHAPNPNGVVFTMNATQAINMGLKGILKPGDHVITSAIEHNAMWRPIKALERQGVEVTVVPCDHDGTLNPKQVETAIRTNTRLIAMLHASNVLATIMPIEEIGSIAARHGILFLVDAAQTAGLIPIDMQTMQIDLLAFPGHKSLFGPHGSGGLVVGTGVELETWMEGGSGVESELETMPAELPARLEAGTHNAAGIAGLLAGVQFVQEKGISSIRQHEMDLCACLIEEVNKIPGVKVLGPADLARRSAVVALTVEGYSPDQLAMVLDQVFDIATRAGLHCAPQAHRTAGTIEIGALRFSPGLFNTMEEIDETVSALRSIL